MIDMEKRPPRREKLRSSKLYLAVRGGFASPPLAVKMSKAKETEHPFRCRIERILFFFLLTALSVH